MSESPWKEPDAAVTASRKEPDAAVAASWKEPDAVVAASRQEPDAVVTASRKEPDAGVAASWREPDAAVAASWKEPDAAVVAERRPWPGAIGPPVPGPPPRGSTMAQPVVAPPPPPPRPVGARPMVQPVGAPPPPPMRPVGARPLAQPFVGPPPRLSARPPTSAAVQGSWQGALRPPVFRVSQPRPTYREPLAATGQMIAAGAAAGAAWMLVFSLLTLGSARAYAWISLVAGFLAWGAAAILARFGDRGVAVGVAASSGVGVAIAGILVAYRLAGGDWLLW